MDAALENETSPSRSRGGGSPPAADRIVVFEIGGQVCALPLDRVREIVPMCELAQPPGLPALLEGLLNLRGEMTPVVRIDRLFDLPPIEFQRHTQLIVLWGEVPVALLCDCVRQVATIAMADRRPAPGDSVFNQCLVGIVSSRGATIHLLDSERLLLDQERQRISELRRMAQTRLAKLQEARP